MSWQEEYLARYEERLKREFTAEGERIPPTYDTLRDKATGWGMFSDEYVRHIDNYNADVYRDNTREICGND